MTLKYWKPPSAMLRYAWCRLNDHFISEIWRMGPRVLMPHIRYKQLSVIELTSNVMTAIAMAL